MQLKLREQSHYGEVLAWLEHDQDMDFSKVNLSLLHELQLAVKNFCLNFDPYTDNATLINEYTWLIDDLKLRAALSNPFTITNRLLQILDKLEQAIKLQIH